MKYAKKGSLYYLGTLNDKFEFLLTLMEISLLIMLLQFKKLSVLCPKIVFVVT